MKLFQDISPYHSNTKWRKKQYLAKVMNNWAFVGKTKNIALKNEEKTQRKNTIATLPKSKRIKKSSFH